MGLPLGWRALPASPGAWLLKVLGLLATAFAMSFGAPFWFDLLNKLVRMRSAGNVPRRADGTDRSAGDVYGPSSTGA